MAHFQLDISVKYPECFLCAVFTGDTFQSFESVFFPDDVYRRKQSEREYQQKIADGLIVLNQSPAKWKMMIGLNKDLTRHLKTVWDTHAIMNAAKETSEKLMVQWLPTCRFYYLYSVHLQHCSIKQQGRRIRFRKMKIITTKALFVCGNHIEISSL